MAVEIDALNLERSINALAKVLNESADRAEKMTESLASIADSLEWVESIADSAERIMAAVELLAQQPKRASRRPSRKRALKAVGT